MSLLAVCYYCILCCMHKLYKKKIKNKKKNSAAYTPNAVADCGRNLINLAATVAEQI